MTRTPGRGDEREHHAAERATTRPVVAGTAGLVAAGHPLVSMAGMRMLLAGGNAFDAAVACGFAAAVVEPTASYTLCGECVAMIHDARRRETVALSGQGTAPALATLETVRKHGVARGSLRGQRPRRARAGVRRCAKSALLSCDCLQPLHNRRCAVVVVRPSRNVMHGELVPHHTKSTSVGRNVRPKLPQPVPWLVVFTSQRSPPWASSCSRESTAPHCGQVRVVCAGSTRSSRTPSRSAVCVSRCSRRDHGTGAITY